MTIEHDDSVSKGFEIEMDGGNGHLYVANLSLWISDLNISVYTPYNSREEWPMQYATIEGSFESGDVFDSRGELSENFKELLTKLYNFHPRAS